MKGRFYDALCKWLAGSFGLALLPLLARLIVNPSGQLQIEGCLFILVLASTGILEAFTDPLSSPSRTILLLLGGVSALYGALGYGTLVGAAIGNVAPNFKAGWLIWPLLASLSFAYLSYKLPLLRSETLQP